MWGLHTRPSGGLAVAPARAAAGRRQRCAAALMRPRHPQQQAAPGGAPPPPPPPPAAPAARARLQRRGPPRAAAAAAPPPPPELSDDERAAVRRGVDRAAATLDEIVEEISREVFVSEAAAYMYSDAPEVALADAVRGAVVRRLEWLDANFLAAVNAYSEAARKLGNGQLVELLAMLRREVLEQVTLRMPPPVRVLDAALQHDRVSARLKVLRSALGGGGGGLPGADMQALAATANQFVDDMEDQEVVADRSLLARLVLVREELRALNARAKADAASQEFFGAAAAAAAGDAAAAAAPAPAAPSGGGQLFEPGAPGGAAAAGGAAPAAATGGGGGAEAAEDDAASIASASMAAAADDGGFFSFHRGNLPRRCAAFVQALLAVSGAPRRLALLRKAFNEDWDGAGPVRPPGTVATGAAGPGGAAEAGPDAQEAPDVVRPGRLLTTLHAMRRELALRRGGGGGGGGGGDASEEGGGGGGGEDVGPLLARLNQIQVEATLVLDEMQRGKGGGGGGGGA
ncbi:MAG: hypothetical protein J3K34DRAFT_501351 [Monoraphidium minutum]|nr:MAG: hypothetical protein J3K34DRAFT_501351 [Monoraphidium minutum]